MTTKNKVGPPFKLKMFGPLHYYSIKKIPKKLWTVFTKSCKQMLGISVSDYLRLRVVNAGHKKIRGKPQDIIKCNTGGLMNWSKIKWIKDPADRKSTMSIAYPKEHWENFKHNCHVRGISPKHALIRFMLELCEEYIKLLKYKKRRTKNARKSN